MRQMPRLPKTPKLPKMMLICGQTNRIWHYWAGRHPGSVGVLISPSYFSRVPIDKWMPFALDNDAFTCWRDGKPWDLSAWRRMIQQVRLSAQSPIWVAIPDVVANREATLANWPVFHPFIKRIGWKSAFCVQDGMTPDDVPHGADVIFVGGSDGWKFPNLRIWTENFPRVHCARVNAPEMFEACERLGCESIDGTGWFRDPSRDDKLPAVERFISGHRNKTDFFFMIVFEPTPRWPGAPSICLAANLPAFAAPAEAASYRKRYCPSSEVLEEWKCRTCGCWHFWAAEPGTNEMPVRIRELIRRTRI